MVQRRQHLRLALEARHAALIIGERGRKDLDSDIAVQPRISRAIHFAHPARTQRADDLIRAETGSIRERHIESTLHRHAAAQIFEPVHHGFHRSAGLRGVALFDHQETLAVRRNVPARENCGGLPEQQLRISHPKSC